jgi:hypothetical protein
VGANGVQQKFGTGVITLKPTPILESPSGICGMVLVFALVILFQTILGSIVDKASGNHIVLVFLSHVSVRGHSQKFLGEHDHGFSMANQTTLALCELGMILATTGSTVRPEIVGYILFQIRLDRHAEILIDNQVDFTLKQLNVSHSIDSFLLKLLLLNYKHSIPPIAAPVNPFRENNSKKFFARFA